MARVTHRRKNGCKLVRAVEVRGVVVGTVVVVCRIDGANITYSDTNVARLQRWPTHQSPEVPSFEAAQNANMTQLRLNSWWIVQIYLRTGSAVQPTQVAPWTNLCVVDIMGG